MFKRMAEGRIRRFGWICCKSAVEEDMHVFK